MPEGNCAVVCIISPSKNAYSETFIRAHIERLPAKVRVLYDGIYQGALPQYSDDGRPLFAPVGLPRRITRSIRRRLFKLPGDYFQKAAIGQFLRQNKVDAVLAEYGPTGVAVMEVCQETSVPLIVYFFGYDAYQQDTLERVGQHYSDLFDVADAIIAVSRHMERHLLGLGAPRNKVHYNPCGVDVVHFQGANPSQVPPSFLAIGRFVDKKAPFLTLLAFKQVLAAVPEAKLIMIGDGYLWEASQQLARAMGIADTVSFPGPLAHSELVAAMRGARAFVQHSLRTGYGDSEGTPVAMLEACATGLPVVSTRHGGIPDVVIDGETGLLVEEGDVAGMAEAMIRLARDPVLAGQLGRAARERIGTKFTMEKTISNLWHIIETAIREHQV